MDNCRPAWKCASPTPTLSPTATPTPPSGSFVVRQGSGLYLDGASYTFRGLNAYNANSRDNCWFAVTDLHLPPGTDVLRAWFYEGLHGDWSAFDATLAAARRDGARVVMTLGDQWGSCDGGFYHTESWYASGYLATYRPWVAEIVTRYRDDPTVLVWELLNEPEDMTTSSGPCSTTAHATLQAWAADVSGLVKSLDPNHLVSLGIGGGGQCGASYTEYADLHSLPTVDLCSYHDYWGPNVLLGGDQWNGLAFRFQQCADIGRPLFIGEAGIQGADEPSLQERANDFAAKMQAQSAAVGYLFWDYCPPNPACNPQSFDIPDGDPTLALLP